MSLGSICSSGNWMNNFLLYFNVCGLQNLMSLMALTLIMVTYLNTYTSVLVIRSTQIPYDIVYKIYGPYMIY